MCEVIKSYSYCNIVNHWDVYEFGDMLSTVRVTK